MAIDIAVPSLGESIKQALLVKWHKAAGDYVNADEPLCELETDKANVDVPAASAGVLQPLAKEGEQVAVGQVIARIEAGVAPVKTVTKSPAAPKTPTPALVSPPVITPPPATKPSDPAVALQDYSPAVRVLLQEHHLNPKTIPATGPNGRLTAEDVQAYLAKGNGGVKAAKPLPPAAAPPVAATSEPPLVFDADGICRVAMSKIRKRIAQTMVQAQQTAAILTTFNEIDLTQVIELRGKYKDRFQELYGVGLGFMSFFARAVVLSLKEFPRINAFIDGDDIVYHNHVNLGIAVSTERGLAVPVLRNIQTMSFARIETEIKRLAGAVRDGKLSLEELSGGTFTITNGGVFGSLLSTPILNPPQSGILGMHAIQKRPVVVNDRIEIRAMMYVALSYDHRLVDGRDSVSFLVRLKQYLEDPARLMLEI